jgi:hypothetical protein
VSEMCVSLGVCPQPTVMGSPDRDVVGYSRLFRYHIVGCSHPSPLNIPLNESGMILDTTGTTASDITYVPGYKTAAMGTVDLDAEWVNRQHMFCGPVYLSGEVVSNRALFSICTGTFKWTWRADLWQHLQDLQQVPRCFPYGHPGLCRARCHAGPRVHNDTLSPRVWHRD